MAQTRILLVDNDREFLETRREFLQLQGFKVMPALDPAEAQRVLEQRKVDLAIFDLRLLNDDDEKDLSGLNLAKRVAPGIPKIILTKFATVEAVRDALGPQLDGLPPVVDFVAKQDGPQVLLTAVRKALKLDTRFRETTESMATEIKEDYESARQQARWNYWVSLVVAVAGTVIVFVGISLAMAGFLEIGLASVVAGVITEAIGALFFKRADVSNSRMDQYHRELLEIRLLETLLVAGEELLIPDRQESCKEKAIEAAIGRWFGYGRPDSALHHVGT